MNIRERLRKDGWFQGPGAYVLVDGQFGSTGKGLLAGYLATVDPMKVTHVTTNAGPNSGHTAYMGGTKVVTQQVPVASVFLDAMGLTPYTLINAGAIIDDVILGKEVQEWLDFRRVFIHPNAAMISADHKLADEATILNIASTGKGIGPALADKVRRARGTFLSGMTYMPMLPGDMNPDVHGWDNFWDWTKDVVFVETAQGFSLGLNSARFYPHVTSRECTVMQAVSDARIPVQMVRKVAMTLRTYPIRVGNVGTEEQPISSGHVYPDQEETTWKDIGQEPEITTVTKRVRRVFKWSRIQFREACAANRPDLLFLNFCNYLSNVELIEMIGWIEEDYAEVMGRELPGMLLGYGPRNEDIKWYGPDAGAEEA